MTRARDLASLGDNTSKLEQQGMVQIIASSVTKGASGSASVNSKGVVTFSGTESISINGVFSSTYTNYKVLVSIDSSTSTGHGNLQFRFGTSGTPNSNTNYNSKGLYFDSGSPGGLEQSGAGKIGFGYLEFSPSANTGTKASVVDILNPFETKQTYAFVQGFGNQFRYCVSNVLFDATTSFTDFYIFPNSNGITGTARIYGYNN